jgi:putative ubiquitin-RnfH superfamily antitoxin RatB of RatAB toxin-antitoxin module
MSERINVEVVYALPHEQTLLSLQVPQGSTVGDAIRASGILEKHPEIDFARNKLGIFGKLSKEDAVLRDRDRVEINRPLIADPKEIRRKRAEEGKAMKKGGGDLLNPSHA